jgi:hypothetical protein
MKATLSRSVLLFLAALALLAAPSVVADEFHLREGDRVVFYGDSITEGRR